jgi:SAM-dependent methyltransferase
MSFSREWENCFQKNTHLSIWPWSDLITYVKRYVDLQKNQNVLELGCGAGANIPFFSDFTNVNYFGIDGSNTIINKLKHKFPLLSNSLVAGDFSDKIPFDKKFDLIFDRGGLTHNSTIGIRKTLKNVSEKLKEGGKYISIDMFSTEHSDYKNGITSTDSFTRSDIPFGPLENTGRVHFSSKDHLLDLFQDFDIIKLEHKIKKFEIPSENYIYASWNILAEKIS